MSSQRRQTVTFFCIAAFCAVLMAWWVYFMTREAGRLEQLGKLIPADHQAEAAKILGVPPDSDIASEVARRRFMFASESIVLGALVVLGVVILYRGMLRERRMRQQQERFLTGATHHLKTPLATVKLGIESLLAGSMPEEKRQQYLESMVREVDHLEKDLTNLLTAGGLEDSRRGLQRERGDLADDVRDAMRSMQDRCNAAQVHLDATGMAASPVDRDREAIHLVLHNLLDNAVKHTEKGGQVRICLERNGNQAQLSITDTGNGILPEDLPYVFDRFYRGGQDQHRGGTGIGLYLARELIDAHHGTIAVHSDGAGKGTSFEIRIPLAKDAS